VTAALVLALAATDVAPLPTVPAHPAWCAKRIGTALEARSPGTLFRLTALRRDGEYAYVQWLAGKAGGEASLVRTDAGWCVLNAGGGMMAVPILVSSGVPHAVAVRLFHAMHPEGMPK
jgi:hypothetical protein